MMGEKFFRASATARIKPSQSLFGFERQFAKVCYTHSKQVRLIIASKGQGIMLATGTRTSVTAQNAAMIAQAFVEDQLGNLICIGRPHHMVSGIQSAWSVPLVLTSPGYGIVGIVGAVMVDTEFGHIIGWTPINEVRANAETLTDENEADLEAAFQSHRSQQPQPQP